MKTCRADRVCGIATQDGEKIASVTGGRILSAPDLLTLCAQLKAHTTPLIRTDFALETQERQYPDFGVTGSATVDSRSRRAGRRKGSPFADKRPSRGRQNPRHVILPGLLPERTADTQRQVNLLRDMAGLSFINGPPLRQPHHSSGIAALMGGTTKATPGEISMEHSGMPFLDELTEFPRPVLNQLRQPLESGEIWDEPRGSPASLHREVPASGRDEPMPLRSRPEPGIRMPLHTEYDQTLPARVVWPGDRSY